MSLDLTKLQCLDLYRVADMDEYDELFEREDDFEEQFADELEVLAQMEGESTCC